MIGITYNDDSVIIYGQKFGSNGLPDVGVEVVIYDPALAKVVARDVTRLYGKYSLVVPKDEIPDGKYELRFYGGGYLPKLVPDGDWESFQVGSGTSFGAIALNSNCGGIFKRYEDGSITPSSTIVTCSVTNISPTNFIWTKNGVTQSGHTSTLTVLATDFSSDLIVITCTVEGLLDGRVMTPMMDVLTLTRLTDGSGAYSVILSNEVLVIATDKDGNNPVPSSGYTDVQLFKGINEITPTFSEEDSSAYGCNAAIPEDGSRITIDMFMADTGYADIVILDGSTYVTTKRFSFVKSKQGATGAAGANGINGPGVTYRGTYDPTKTYRATNDFRDVARYRVLITDPWVYYFCKVDNSTGTFDLTHWTALAYFETVATGLLLTDDAVITHCLTLGTDGAYSGILRSANATAALAGNGLFMSDSTNGIFRVGSVVSGALSKGIYWDGSDIQVQSANFILQQGKLWANSGGFGGSFLTPSIALNSTGITVGNKIVITDSTTIFDDPTALRGANALPVFSPLATYWNVTALVLGGATITGGALDLSTGKEQAAYDLTTVALKTGATVPEGVPGTASTYVLSFRAKSNAIGAQAGEAYVNIKDSATGTLLKKVGLNYGTLHTVVIDPYLAEYEYSNIMSDWNNVTISFQHTSNAFKLEFVVRSGDAVYGEDCDFDNELFVDQIYLTAYAPKVILSGQGLLVYQTPQSYFKMSASEFVFKGMDVEVESLTVRGNIYLAGSTYAAASNLMGTTSPIFTIGVGGSSLTKLIFDNTVQGILSYNGTIFSLSRGLSVSGGITLSSLVSGFLKADASGVLSTLAQLSNADIASAAAIAWTKISKSGSNLTDMATRNHSDLSGVGTNAHSVIDTHIATTGDATIHHVHSNKTYLDAINQALATTSIVTFSYLTTAHDATINGIVNVNPPSPVAPFVLNSNARGHLVTGLNADQVDGFDLNQALLTTSSPTFSALTITNDLTIGGCFTVNGTTVTINATTLTVDDKNIEIGSVNTPTDGTANGGGLTLKGTIDKTITWDSPNVNWTASENWNLLTGKVFKINNVQVLSATALGNGVLASYLTSVGVLTSLAVAGDAVFGTDTHKLTVSMFNGNAMWIDMPITGPSGIGSGGAGADAWIAYVQIPGHWFTDSEAGDIAYRNTSGRLLFGTNGDVPTLIVQGECVGINVMSPAVALDVDGGIRLSGYLEVHDLGGNGNSGNVTISGWSDTITLGDDEIHYKSEAHYFHNAEGTDYRLTIVNTGVGIGRPDAATRLHVGDNDSQNTVRVMGHGANKAAVVSLFNYGNREGFIAQTAGSLYIGNASGLANYNDATIIAGANITITNAGKVGIGMTPDNKLDVNGEIFIPNNNALLSKNTSGTVVPLIRLTASNNLRLLTGFNSNIEIFNTAQDTQLVTVTNAGYIGIGCIPAVTLEVNGTSYFGVPGATRVSITGGGYIGTISPSANDNIIVRAKGTGSVFVGYGNGSGGLRIYDGGTANIGSWISGSTANSYLNANGGNVGVGLSGPTYHLEVRGGSAGGNVALFEGNNASDGSGASFCMKADSYNGVFSAKNYKGAYDAGINLIQDGSLAARRYSLLVQASTGNLLFATDTSNSFSGLAGTVLAALTSTGNFGLGIIAATAKIHISGNGGWASAIRMDNTSGHNWSMYPTASYYTINDETAGVARISIDNTGNVGIGRNPGSKLDVNGDLRVSQATGTSAVPYIRLYNTDTGGWMWRIGLHSSDFYIGAANDTDQLLTISSAGIVTIKSTADSALTNCGGISKNDFASQTTGYRITQHGDADFRSIYADQLHVKSFIADLEQTLAGEQMICKSVAKLAVNFVYVPGDGDDGWGDYYVTVEEFDGFIGNVFEDNDVVRFRVQSRISGGLNVTDMYGWVFFDSRYGSGADPKPWTQTYLFQPFQYPTSAITFMKGSLALDYGAAGNGYYEVSAIDGNNGSNSPYSQIVTWDYDYDEEWNTLMSPTVQSRLGNLAGLTSPVFGALKDYGLWTQNLFAEKNVSISGTLTAGDIRGVGNTFMAGRITRNLAPYSDYSNHVYGTVYTCDPSTGFGWGGDTGTAVCYANGGYSDLPYKVLNKTTGGTGGIYLDSSPGIQIYSGRTYLISCWLKASSAYTDTDGQMLGLNRIADNVYKSGTTPLSITTEWKRFYRTYFASSSDTGIYQNRAILYEDAILPLSVYSCGFQVEDITGTIQKIPSQFQPTDAGSAITYGPELITNGTDWVHSTNVTPGLADGFVATYDSAKFTVTYSLTSGNGFTGNAQRVHLDTSTSGGAGGWWGIMNGPTNQLTVGKKYSFSMKYRSSYPMCIQAQGGAVYVNYPVNTGSCQSATGTFIATSPGFFMGVCLTSFAGSWLEIDEASLKEITENDEEYGMWVCAGGIGGTMQNPVVSIADYGLRIRSAEHTIGLADGSIMIGNITGTAVSALKLTNTGVPLTSGLFGYTSGGGESFALRLNGTASLAGWDFDTATLSSASKVFISTAAQTAAVDTIKIDAADTRIFVGSSISLSGLSTGTILIGSAASVDAGVGIYADGNGNFRAGMATSSGTDFIKVTPIATTIKASVFSLIANTDDLVIDSVSKKISLAAGAIVLDGGVSATCSVVTVGPTAGSKIQLYGDTNLASISTGKTSYSDTTAGFWIARNSGVTEFYAGDANSYLKFISTGVVSIKTSSFTLASGKTVASDTTNAGLWINGTDFYVGTASDASYLKYVSGALSMKASTFNLSTSTIVISSASTGSIALGSATAFGTGTGLWLDGGGNFRAGTTAGNRISYASDGTVTLVSNYAQITGNSGWLGASNFLTWSGTTVTAAGWTIDASRIYKSLALGVGAGYVSLANEHGGTGYGQNIYSAGLSLSVDTGVVSYNMYFGELPIAKDGSNNWTFGSTPTTRKHGFGIFDYNNASPFIEFSYLNNVKKAVIAGWDFTTSMLRNGVTAGNTGNTMYFNNANTTGTGTIYGQEIILKGIVQVWRQSNNAGHLVLGELAASATSVKTGYYGLQMMDHNGNEFFALSSDTVSTAVGDHSYNRLAGFAFSYQSIWSSNLAGGSDGAYTTAGVILNSSGWISAKNFYIDSSGNAKFRGDISGASGTFTGSITGASGTIGGITFNASGITSTNFSVSTSGVATLTGANVNGSLNVTSASAFSGAISVTGSSITLSGGSLIAGNVTLNSSGLSGTNYSINASGVTATAGAIGGFALGAHTLSTGSGATLLEFSNLTSNLYVKGGTAAISANVVLGAGFYIGQDPSNNAFGAFIGSATGTNLFYNGNTGILNLAGSITSTATITGGTIQTASSGARIKMTGNNVSLYAGSSWSNSSAISFLVGTAVKFNIWADGDTILNIGTDAWTGTAGARILIGSTNDRSWNPVGLNDLRFMSSGAIEGAMNLGTNAAITTTSLLPRGLTVVSMDAPAGVAIVSDGAEGSGNFATGHIKVQAKSADGQWGVVSGSVNYNFGMYPHGAHISWGAVAGASVYRVYIYEDGDYSKYIDTTNTGMFITSRGSNYFTDVQPEVCAVFTKTVIFKGQHADGLYEMGTGTSIVDWNNGNKQRITNASDGMTYSLTFKNPLVGAGYILLFTASESIDAITFPSNIRWAGGIAPDGSSGNLSCSFIYDGTNYLGYYTVN
jgi:hypothetical protein